MMNKRLNLLLLFLPFSFLNAEKEYKEEIVDKKEATEKVASSTKIKPFSHITSITVPTILFLLGAYFPLKMNVPGGLFKNKYVNTLIFSVLSSVVGFYFYLYLEAFLAKQMPSAIGKFFSGLISFLLSGCVIGIFTYLYRYKHKLSALTTFEVLTFFEVGLFFSLNSSLLSWFIYKGINWFFIQ